jgi:membrane protease YdiL (CAAX protease family)
MSDDSFKPPSIPRTTIAGSWGPTVAIIGTVIAFIGAQLVAGVLVVVFGLLGLRGGNQITAQFFYAVGADVLMALIVWQFLRIRNISLRAVGFLRSPLWKDIGYALVAFVVYILLLGFVTSIVSALTHIDLNQKQELGFDNLVAGPEKIMAFISLVILPPIVEETVFRGFLFTGLRKKLTFVWATAITSLIFAGPHLLASSDGLLWVAGVDTLVLSIVLCYLREKTGALWSPIVVHALKNSIAFMYLLGVISL